MPKPTAKEIKKTAKWIDRLTAVYIHNNPGTLQHFGKERIRNDLLNDELRKAFRRFEGSNK